ncbi:MAG: hypothetical protein MJ133_07960 [Lachnospiraceae bacterium]|nr:hypothetical protein [Lachnospiraceae bacterium]
MFDILTNHTIEDCNELMDEVNFLRKLIADAESAKKNLGALTQMEQVQASLKAVIQSMEDETHILKLMAQALDKINYAYVNTENKICDYAELGVIQYTRRDLRSVDLNQISSMLKDVTLE